MVKKGGRRPREAVRLFEKKPAERCVASSPSSFAEIEWPGTIEANIMIVSDLCFDSRRQRLAYLETWRELGVRPGITECFEEDKDLLFAEIDNLGVLGVRCDEARKLMNDAIPTHVTKYDGDLVVSDSFIECAGKGLFYRPLAFSSSVLPRGATICFYYGDIHTFRSSNRLLNKSYLMLLGGDILVDSISHLTVLARFINDPINEKYYNCRFEPDAEQFRSKVVATRDIHPDEELFAPYGEAYWSLQHYNPKILTGLSVVVKNASST